MCTQMLSSVTPNSVLFLAIFLLRGFISTAKKNYNNSAIQSSSAKNYNLAVLALQYKLYAYKYKYAEFVTNKILLGL